MILSSPVTEKTEKLGQLGKDQNDSHSQSCLNINSDFDVLISLRISAILQWQKIFWDTKFKEFPLCDSRHNHIHIRS